MLLRNMTRPGPVATTRLAVQLRSLSGILTSLQLHAAESQRVADHRHLLSVIAALAQMGLMSVPVNG